MNEFPGWDDCVRAVGRSIGAGAFEFVRRSPHWEPSTTPEESFYWSCPSLGVSVFGEYCNVASCVVVEAVFLYGSDRAGSGVFRGQLLPGVRFGAGSSEVLDAYPSATRGGGGEATFGPIPQWIKVAIDGREAHIELKDDRVDMIVIQRKWRTLAGPEPVEATPVEVLLDGLSELTNRDVERMGVTMVMAKISAICEQLRLHPRGADGIESLFLLIERVHCLEFDVGDVIETIEFWPRSYPPVLLESLRRRPTTATLELAKGLLFRRLHEEIDWIQAVQATTTHPLAVTSAKAMAIRIVEEYRAEQANEPQ